MSQFTRWVPACIVVALLAPAAPAAAAPLLITSGFVTVSGAEFGSRGFLRSIAYDLLVDDDFRLMWSDTDGVPQNVFAPRLVTPSQWTPSGGDTQLVAVLSDLSFTATPSLLPSPFDMMGSLTLLTQASNDVLLSVDVVGSGTATWRFDVTPFGDSVVGGVTYHFAPASVPEPGMMLLMALAVAGLAVRSRRRSPRRDGAAADAT